LGNSPSDIASIKAAYSSASFSSASFLGDLGVFAPWREPHFQSVSD
jgi:hypothetical protein